MVHQSQFIARYGNMTANYKLSDIAEVYDGVHQTPHYTESGIRFISVEDISDIYSSKKYISNEDYAKYKHVPEKGDVIMTRIGTIGQCAVVTRSEPIAYYVSVSLIKPDNTIIDSIYLKYYIESDYGKNELRMRSLLEAFPMKINLNEIGKIRVIVPSINEQKQFVAIVQQADKSKFDGFKSQFIEMFGTIKSPTACDVMTVGDAVERGIIEKPMDGNHGSKHPTADEYVDSGIPFLLANNITEDGVDLVNCSFITKERASRLDKGFAHNGDVLLTHKGTVGRVAILKCPNYEFVMLTPQVTYYRPLKGLSAEYLKAYFESQGFQEEIMSIASSGATRAYIGITEQRNLHLLIPNTECQRSFVTIVKQADKSKYLN